jgi:dolichyl-phosphate beta-D-mannosyltransferase
LGPAYLAAFSWAISGGYTWVAEFDADGSHRPADLQRLLALAHGTSAVDLVIGSRWCRGGGTEGWAITRQILSRLGSAYVNLLLNLGVHDTTAGFRVYRTDFLNNLLQRSQIESRGYGFQIEMTWRSARQGAAIKEVPITFVERRAGTSKMSGSIIREALVEVMRWKLCEIFAPRRFD